MLNDTQLEGLEITVCYTLSDKTCCIKTQRTLNLNQTLYYIIQQNCKCVLKY